MGCSAMFHWKSLFLRITLCERVRKLTDQVLRSLSGEFDQLYAATGRPPMHRSIFCGPCCLQVFYTIRLERQLAEQIDYNLLFRWFIGLGMDDAVWNHAGFSKNRGRLLTSAVAQQFFSEINRQAERFMSD
jgi:transposase